VAPAEEIIERLRELGRAGMDQLVLNPPFIGFEEYVDEVSRQIIARL